MSISFFSAVGRFGPSGMYVMRGDTEGTSEKGDHGKGTTHWKRETERGRSSVERRLDISEGIGTRGEEDKGEREEVSGEVSRCR